MVWKTNKEVRQTNIQLECNMLYDWPIGSQLDTAIISAREAVTRQFRAKWLTSRLCVITFRTIYSITNISHT